MSDTTQPGTPHEQYRYAREGARILKSTCQPKKINEHRNQVRYLPGLEIRTHASGDRQTENLRVVIVNGTRILHWQQGKPGDVHNNQMRFNVADRSGSTQSELDRDGNIISQEQYYPFGGTALWATRNQTEARYKTVRYSGKEHDVTCLVYYGYRYYAPWLMRWINTDPEGTVNGLHLYKMADNNPVTIKDDDGRMWQPPAEQDFAAAAEQLGVNFARHLLQNPPVGNKPILDNFNFIASLGRTPGSTSNEIAPDDMMAIMFADNIHGQRRLNIVGHGEHPAGAPQGYLMLNGYNYTAGDLLDEYHINPEQFDCIRLAVCHSGERGFSSLAARMSTMTGKPVTGFEGFVTGNWTGFGSKPLETLSQVIYNQRWPVDLENRLFDRSYWAFATELEKNNTCIGENESFFRITTVNPFDPLTEPFQHANFSYEPRFFYTHAGNKNMVDREWMRIRHN